MGVGPVCQTSLPSGLSEWGLVYISHATQNGPLYWESDGGLDSNPRLHAFRQHKHYTILPGSPPREWGRPLVSDLNHAIPGMQFTGGMKSSGGADVGAEGRLL